MFYRSTQFDNAGETLCMASAATAAAVNSDSIYQVVDSSFYGYKIVN
ncbi:hypothetical protein [Chryseobacterium sp. G0201]|nr:hypothetical protein [Chryseobacterium sp. G0201]